MKAVVITAMAALLVGCFSAVVWGAAAKTLDGQGLETVRTPIVAEAGAGGTLRADLNGDGYVDLRDWVELWERWMWCSDPGEAECDGYWKADDIEAWRIDPYENFKKDRARGAGEPLLEGIEVHMAQGEYRDALFMVGPYGGTRHINIAVETSAGMPVDMILVQETLYLINRGDGGTQYTGDAVHPLAGALTVPAGESRQVRLRFDARSSGVEPNEYQFAVILTDSDTGALAVIPGRLTVWDFELPSTDVLPNNGYAHFINSPLNFGQAYINGVKEMKPYGMNMIFVHPVENPRVASVDGAGNVLAFNDNTFLAKIDTAIQAWNAVPGEETLLWEFQLWPLDLGLAGGPAYPSAAWRTMCSQWLSHLKALLSSRGITVTEWTLTFGDEESASTLMDYTIPLAEIVKSMDPTIRLTCNSSAMLSEPWTSRYFAAFDIFQPDLDVIDGGFPWSNPALLPWLKTSGNILWTYNCRSDWGLVGMDIYTYYRVYAWKMVKYDLTGIGIWTYSETQGSGDPWVSPNYGNVLAIKHWSSNEVVHMRRYEMYRETVDDYRYIHKLREVAVQRGGAAPAEAEALIEAAISDITGNLWDHTLCDQWRMIIAEEILGTGTGYEPSNYFTDAFDGSSLNARWHEDNSPQNPAGSELVVASGWARSDTNYQEAYHHLETDINASGNFTVQAMLRCSSGMGVGAPHLVVYWDATHFVALEAGRGSNCAREYYNGSSFTSVDSTLASVGWDFYNMKMDFGPTTVKFYLANYEQGYTLVYHPELDLPRQPWMTGAALMIMGKGSGNPIEGTEPDFDNDAESLEGADHLIIESASYQPVGGFFADTFDGSILNARWHEDNSPLNPAGSELVVASGWARSDTNTQEQYHHIETAIDATGNFAVQAKVRCSSGMGPGAAHLAVYWDVTHSVGISARRGSYVHRDLYNGSAFTLTPSSYPWDGWDFCNMVLEFTETQVKFHAADYAHDYVPQPLTEITMAREPWMTGSALMIVGKGSANPVWGSAADYDNEEPIIYGADHLIIDDASYQPLGTVADFRYECGAPGTVYLWADLNEDCYVNLPDVCELAAQWLWCTDPENSACGSYWQ